MDVENLKTIFNQFNHKANFASFTELKSGHINDTFFIKTDTKTNYVLQRINDNVFKNVPGLVNNKVLISTHLKSIHFNTTEKKLQQTVLSFVNKKNTKKYYYKIDENYWNLMIFIDESKTHEIVKDKEIAYEAGKLLGIFLNQTSNFDSSQLVEVIPNFHNMNFRFHQYEASLKSASENRILKAEKYIKTIAALKDEMHLLQKLKDQGKIPIKVTHNDTKISNALFDKSNKGICMIDTDTVMPGIIHYDFGDAIRTICNTAAEDEKDLLKVTFNVEFYTAYTKGFLEKTKDSLSVLEIKHLPLAAKTMIFIMALRFLTDYLNNDIYYKTNYKEHNLDRAKNQFKLIESFSEKIAI